MPLNPAGAVPRTQKAPTGFPVGAASTSVIGDVTTSASPRAARSRHAIIFRSPRTARDKASQSSTKTRSGRWPESPDRFSLGFSGVRSGCVSALVLGIEVVQLFGRSLGHVRRHAPFCRLRTDPVQEILGIVTVTFFVATQETMLLFDV